MTEILLYGIIGDEWDGLDAKTIFGLIAGGDDDIVAHINSPGGYVMEGLAIYNAFAGAKAAGRKVTIHIDGLAASMASVIAMAGDEIIMADNALMMIHNHSVVGKTSNKWRKSAILGGFGSLFLRRGEVPHGTPETAEIRHYPSRLGGAIAQGVTHE